MIYIDLYLLHADEYVIENFKENLNCIQVSILIFYVLGGNIILLRTCVANFHKLDTRTIVFLGRVYKLVRKDACLAQTSDVISVYENVVCRRVGIMCQIYISSLTKGRETNKAFSLIERFP